MNKVVSALERGLLAGGRRLNLVGASLLFLLVLIVTADVISRKLFAAPIKGGLEISQIGLLLVVFFAIAHTQAERGHVASDILSKRFPPRAWEIIDSVIGLVVLAVFGLLIYAGVNYSIETWHSGSKTTMLGIPLFPFRFAIGFGLFVLWLVLLVQWLHPLYQVLKKKSNL